MLRQGLRALSSAGLARLHGGATTRHARAAATATQAIAPAVPAPPGDGPNHRSMMNLDAHTIRPYVQPDSYVAPSASIIGSVVVNSKASVLYGAVVRGDLALIHVGMLALVGDNAVLTAGRVDADGRSAPREPGPEEEDNQESGVTLGHSEALSPGDAVATGLAIDPELYVGDYSTIGANARVHGAYLAGDNVVGDGASVGDGARLERYATVLPGAWVPDGTLIGDGEVWGGSPATKVGSVSDDERVSRRQDAIDRFKTTARHTYEFLPVGMVYLEKEAMARK